MARQNIRRTYVIQAIAKVKRGAPKAEIIDFLVNSGGVTEERANEFYTGIVKRAENEKKAKPAAQAAVAAASAKKAEVSAKIPTPKD